MKINTPNSESDDHYPSSHIFLALRSGGSGGTHCLDEVAMLLLHHRYSKPSWSKGISATADQITSSSSQLDLCREVIAIPYPSILL